MIDRKEWQEFKDTKLLWWVNRILHTFGWAIVLQVEEDGKISDVYPARVKFRGFSKDIETNGFIGLSEYLKKNIDEIEKEARD